ncbi:hypothetical protein GCM10011348_47380 [Marinobacterium nitratireducens]|uniref:NAD-specific glutamate dehydrogenase C-terminal domain-containing protein n=1 Tax=Marinobacterium nitratireducens TaxID=518897 RepID=A0A918DY26_9GAMM
MTDEVARLVLRHNYGQSQILSTAMLVSTMRINDHRRLMQDLEKAGRLDRELEYLPGEEQCAELVRNGQGLSRPEIAVLLAYSKLWLCDQLVAAGVGEDQDLAEELYSYFPSAVCDRFGTALQQHPLHAEVLATHLTNLLCNRMGSTFISYVMGEVHCNALEAVRAWYLARDLLDVSSLWQELETCETRLDDTLFRQQLLHIHAQLERIVLWLLHRHGNQISISQLRQRYGHHIPEMTASLQEFRDPSEQQACRQECQALQSAGLSQALAERLASLRELSKGLEIIELAQDSGQDNDTARHVYFAVDHYLELGPLRRLIAALPKQDLWQRKARSALTRDVDSALVRACLAVIGGRCEGETLDDRLESWKTASAPILAQLRQLYGEIQAHERPDLPMLSVAVRELNNLQYL